jgi:L-fucose isomerase-like protein
MKYMSSSIQYLAIASEFMTRKEKGDLINKYSFLLEKKKIYRTDTSLETEHLIYFILSGGVEGYVYNLIEQRNKFSQEPVVLLAHTENNSLPAALELLAKLNQEETEGRIFLISSPFDHETVDKMYDYLLSYDTPRPLPGVKIGLLGQPSDWLIASSPDSNTVKNNWGPDVIFLSTDILFKKLKQITTGDIEPLLLNFRKNATAIIEPDEDEIVDSLKVFAALKIIIEEYELDAISLRCFDLVTMANTTGCYALAKLNEEDICSSCEGDVVSLLAILWLKKLTGETSWMANLSSIDVTQNQIHLAHCTIAFNLIDEYTIRSHFESGKGIGIQGKLPLIPVTIVRIGGKQLDKLWILEGTITETPDSENLCRTQVVVKVNDKSKLEELLSDPLGNHLVLIRGHHKNNLIKNWITFFGE